MRIATLLFLLFPLCLSAQNHSPAKGGVQLELKPQHRFFDAKNIAAISVMAGSITADVHSTCRGMQRGGMEGNPLMPETCKGTVWAGIAKGIGFVSLGYLYHNLGRKNSGWHKAERIVFYVIAVPGYVAAGFNYRF